jgi:glycogen operon protein
MTDEEWNTAFARSLGLWIMGSGGSLLYAPAGEPDDDFLLLFNAHHEEIPFTLPGPAEARWSLLLDTGHEDASDPDGFFKPGDEYPLVARSLAVLKRPRRESG